VKIISLVVAILLLSSGKVTNKDTQLRLGILKNSPSQVSEALKMGANPNQEVVKGRSLLMEASFKGRFTQVKTLIQNGAKVNYRGKNGQTALIQAANGGNLRVLKHLVSQGAKINHKTSSGSTALKVAVLSENIEMTKYLLGKGADAAMPGLGKKDIRSLAKESKNKNLLELFK
jgi:ankyrin repeat protein